MSKTLNMTQGRPLSLLIRFSLPLMFANMFQQLYTVVDTAIVGKGVGMAALAALGGVDWLNWMMLGIAQGFTQGFSVRISQKFGEEDWAGLRRFMGQSALITAVLSLISEDDKLNFVSNLPCIFESAGRTIRNGKPIHPDPLRRSAGGILF